MEIENFSEIGAKAIIKHNVIYLVKRYIGRLVIKENFGEGWFLVKREAYSTTEKSGISEYHRPFYCLLSIQDNTVVKGYLCYHGREQIPAIIELTKIYSQNTMCHGNEV